MNIFTLVLSANGDPQDPVQPGLARKLARSGKAAWYRFFPPILRMKEAAVGPTAPPKPHVLKIHPGKTTGFALIDEEANRVVREMQASGEKPITMVELERHLGL